MSRPATTPTPSIPPRPVISRAAQAEVERQRARRSGIAGSSSRVPVRARRKEGDDDAKKDERPSKGAGRKDDVQRKPEDQRSNPDPKEGEGRGAA